MTLHEIRKNLEEMKETLEIAIQAVEQKECCCPKCGESLVKYLDGTVECPNCGIRVDMEKCATNGDVMQMLFPDFDFLAGTEQYVMRTMAGAHNPVVTITDENATEYNIFQKSWWNTPYKRRRNQ